jgi:glutathione S-transferase
MKLYHHPLSSCSRRVTLAAVSLGIRYEEHLVDLANPEHRATLTSINPNSKIPVLKDGDLILWESHAIMQYFCALTPGQTLYPSDARARADVNRWLFWISSHLTEAVGGLNFEHIWKKMIGMGGPDPEKIKRHEQSFHQLATILDNHLAGRAWLSGEMVTLADLSAASTFMYIRPAKLPIEPYANVRTWFARMRGLGAWKATEPSAMFR